jgi:formamidopyrimidine-DNA glycosylase
VVFELADGRDLRFVDPRRFGLVDVVERGRERAHPSLAVLGP